jgi:hypothetical protein
MTASTSPSRWPSQQQQPRCSYQVGLVPWWRSAAPLSAAPPPLPPFPPTPHPTPPHPTTPRHDARDRTHANACGRTTPCATHADIPLVKAVAGVRVGYLPAAGGWVINPSAAQARALRWRAGARARAHTLLLSDAAGCPGACCHQHSHPHNQTITQSSPPPPRPTHTLFCTPPQMASSKLDLLMAGTADAVLMIEGFCDWLTEEQMIEVRSCVCACACLCVLLLSVCVWWERVSRVCVWGGGGGGRGEPRCCAAGA